MREIKNHTIETIIPVLDQKDVQFKTIIKIHETIETKKIWINIEF